MKQNKHTFWVLCTSLFMLWFHSACENSDFHGTGDTITEVRHCSSFHSVTISDNIETHFHFNNIGESSRIEVIGGDKLLPKIKTSVVDSVLTISNENTWNWIRSYEKSKIIMNIYTNPISSVKYDGYADVVFHDTLFIPSFSFESTGGMGNIFLKVYNDSCFVGAHTGSPAIYIDGRCKELYLFTHSHGLINATNLTTDNGFVHSKGTADCYISPLITLGVTLEYIGNAYYKNNPVILWLSEQHQGKLIKID